jgi:hypothetical protein
MNKSSENLFDKDNQQGRKEISPSTTTRPSPKKLSTKNMEGYHFDVIKRRWVRTVKDGKVCCRDCKEWKTVENFPWAKRSTQRLSQYCRNCKRFYKAAKRYNITVEEVKKLYSAETCDCCGENFHNQTHQHIHHLKDSVIGTLCFYCNLILKDESPQQLHRLKSCVDFIENRMKI